MNQDKSKKPSYMIRIYKKARNVLILTQIGFIYKNSKINVERRKIIYITSYFVCSITGALLLALIMYGVISSVVYILLTFTVIVYLFFAAYLTLDKGVTYTHAIELVNHFE